MQRGKMLDFESEKVVLNKRTVFFCLVDPVSLFGTENKNVYKLVKAVKTHLVAN